MFERGPYGVQHIVHIIQYSTRGTDIDGDFVYRSQPGLSIRFSMPGIVRTTAVVAGSAAGLDPDLSSFFVFVFRRCCGAPGFTVCCG